MSILDKYGIKEVADVTFYQLDNDGNPTVPVLYLDTLKVSTIEQTAENTSARGGKGNPELILWDYNKEITVTLEDALFSAKSMAIMYGAVNSEGQPVFGTDATIKKTVPYGSLKTSNSSYFVDMNGEDVELTDVSFYTDKGSATSGTSSYAYAVGTLTPKAIDTIEISSNKFPGTYAIIGDTYARSEATGEDEFFQFTIAKAKILSEVTLTLEAEGDPTTFSMNVKVLKPKSGTAMMKLTKYTFQ
jgi:hypothetical protein